MPELITKKPTEAEKLEKKVIELEAEVLKQTKAKKRPSIGYFRARFK